MHRIIRVNSAQFSNLSRLRLTSNETFGCNEFQKTCSLCKKTNSYFKTLWRPQSTHANPNQSSTKPRKKRKKPIRSYAELLIVTDRSTLHQRASVTKLTSSDLKLLATTNLNLSELYKLKELSSGVRFVNEHTYNNLAIIENMPLVGDGSAEVKDIFTSGESDNRSVINLSIPSNPLATSALISAKMQLPVSQGTEEVDLGGAEAKTDVLTEVDQDHEILENIPSSRLQALEPEVLDEHPEPVIEVEEVKDKPIRSFIDQKAREEVEHKSMASYMEICSVLSNPQRGLNALHFHMSRSRFVKDKYFVNITKVGVYNVLLKGFAAKGNFRKVQEIIQIAKSEDVDLDVHSYGAIMECLGRIDIENNHQSDIRSCVEELLARRITFNQIMNDCCFLGNERSFVLKAMQSFDPRYQPQYQRPNVHYKNHLVDDLNCPEQLEPPKDALFVNNRGLFTPQFLRDVTQKQLEFEKASHVTVNSIEATDEPSEEVLKYRESLAAHYEMWEEAGLKAFNRDLQTLTAQKMNKLNYEPYMRSIPAKDFVSIIVDEAKKLAQGSETYSPTVKQLHRDLGRRVYARYMVLRKQKTGVIDKIVQIHNKYCDDYAACHPELSVEPTRGELLNPRQKWQWAEHSLKGSGSTLSMNHQEWVPPVLQFIGKFLYHIVMHDLKVDVNCMRLNSKHKNNLPAFYTIFRTQGRLVKEEVKPHPVLSKLYRAAMPKTLTFPSYELPMLCPPLPWVSVNQGGYLIVPCDMVRLPYLATAQKQRLHEATPEQLFPSLDALNQLASVPWKVNQKILNVILEVFNSGGSASLDVPEPPSSLPPPVLPAGEIDKNQKYQYFRMKLQHRRKKAEMYSLWCDCLYRLSLANHFRNNIFWLPHNMDFRGRVYPVPPHLNHLGSDLARSMLVFAESRPLGPKGLDWLKIHLINLTGLKKRDPVSERLKYADEQLDAILDSADRPLTGRRWWAESEEPWQTLACCMEIAEAVRSDRPEDFRSHFPVHQDGSCNGLQHYAALGRDQAGARSVNLTASEQPQDVYSAVVALVEEQRQRDADNGIEVANLLKGFVKRKVIKQTIMTTVYGVTRFGARLQIARQLRDIDDFPKTAVWGASSYLTAKTFESLRTMFTSTREIQDWFTECARLISAVGGQQVEWVTPMGLPVVQPYFRPRKANYSKMYDTFQMDKFEKPNVMKQKNAFAPNFIHSLDSSHMMLTSLYSERAGITFVSVHDCYWTHSSTVHIMNKICREQFVALHCESILENLSVFFDEKYSYQDNELPDDGSVLDLTKKKLNRVLRKLPRKGEFDINEVLKSVYFFS